MYIKMGWLFVYRFERTAICRVMPPIESLAKMDQTERHLKKLRGATLFFL
jgi:hypothetical protein